MTLSVALAAYRGERYLEEQVASILPQLSPRDELILSVDPSADGTRAVAERLAAADARVCVIDGPGRGVIANFERAISETTGDIVALSDQDDVWDPAKAEAIRAVFEGDPALTLFVHDAAVVDGDLTPVADSFFAIRQSGRGLLKNILRNSYIGCCMAAQGAFLRELLPFPQGIPMHDQWIGLQADRRGRVLFDPRRLIRWRRHGGNATGERHAGLLQMIAWRARLIGCLLRAGAPRNVNDRGVR